VAHLLHQLQAVVNRHDHLQRSTTHSSTTNSTRQLSSVCAKSIGSHCVHTR
jgi:hypothetical protein